MRVSIFILVLILCIHNTPHALTTTVLSLYISVAKNVIIYWIYIYISRYYTLIIIYHSNHFFRISISLLVFYRFVRYDISVLLDGTTFLFRPLFDVSWSNRAEYERSGRPYTSLTRGEVRIIYGVA